VYPREIEEVLFQHPAIVQCAVVGRPDEAGELPTAFVQLQPDAKATDTELMDFANKQLAPYKKIREVIFVDAIPVSAAGKVLKRELRDQLQ
jgi:long-chain acyl-CoA synthetase